MGSLCYQISRLSIQCASGINTGKKTGEVEPGKSPTNMKSLALPKLMALE